MTQPCYCARTTEREVSLSPDPSHPARRETDGPAGRAQNTPGKAQGSPVLGFNSSSRCRWRLSWVAQTEFGTSSPSVSPGNSLDL